jgi:excisionase family DNA binding protein
MGRGLLTTEEVAGKLGVTATRVRAMIAAGRLPAEKYGVVYLIKESDLKLVEDRKVGRPSKPKARPDSKASQKKHDKL